MSNLDEKIASFKDKQAEIMKLHEQYRVEMDKVTQDCESRIEAIKTEHEVKKAELSQGVDKAKADYKAAVKDAFGVTDGETINVLDMVQFIQRVSAMK